MVAGLLTRSNNVASVAYHVSSHGAALRARPVLPFDREEPDEHVEAADVVQKVPHVVALVPQGRGEVVGAVALDCLVSVVCQVCVRGLPWWCLTWW